MTEVQNPADGKEKDDPTTAPALQTDETKPIFRSGSQ